MNGYPSNSHWPLIIFISLLVVVFSVSIIVLVKNRPTDIERRQFSRLTEPIIRGDEPVLGPDFAKITLVEYADFGCAACKEATGDLKQLLDEFAGEIRVVWKGLPNERAIPGILQTHHAARCAQAQGKFWEFHDAVFASQKIPTTKEDLMTLALGLGLEITQFGLCLNDPAPRSFIQKDLNEALQLRINKTPTFFIEGERFNRVPSARAIKGNE